MRRVEEMFKARRNSVSSSNVVGKTLNSTGLRMYSATIITVTDIIMSKTSSTSSRNGGTGVISARTMPNTATGTPSSFQSTAVIQLNCFGGAAPIVRAGVKIGTL